MSLRVLVFALISVSLMCPVFAQSAAVWTDSQPVFQSPDETRRSIARQFRFQRRKYPEMMSGGRRPYITPQAPKIISVPNNEPKGTVIIVTKARKLYYTLSRSRAYEYSISVGRQGFAWTGIEKISRISDWPDWHPPAEMRQRDPWLPKKMTGGLRNPLGAAALYLGDTLYRIHGTNNARSIGRAASSGCFRMMNQHILHLARMVNVGTTVKVVNNWRLSGATNSGVRRALR
ncbi:putative L,D-transpeptidase ErfK/SrfK [bacterium MnTg02]|nr:putative L,D-transpeptidase ErfK/SrfK [bacterium MnTg02]